MTSNKLSQSEYDRRMIVTRQKYYEDDVICRYCGPDGCDCEVDPSLPTDEQLIVQRKYPDAYADYNGGQWCVMYAGLPLSEWFSREQAAWSAVAGAL